MSKFLNDLCWAGEGKVAKKGVRWQKGNVSRDSTSYFAHLLKRLRAVTFDCREDMHEPDEQGIKCTVEGDHLDNAMGDDPMHSCGEFIVGLRRADTGITEYFNLANLIALARNPMYEGGDEAAHERLVQDGVVPIPKDAHAKLVDALTRAVWILEGSKKQIKGYATDEVIRIGKAALKANK